MQRKTESNIKGLANQSENLLDALDRTIRDASELGSVNIAIQLVAYKKQLAELAKVARDIANQIK